MSGKQATLWFGMPEVGFDLDTPLFLPLVEGEYRGDGEAGADGLS